MQIVLAYERLAAGEDQAAVKLLSVEEDNNTVESNHEDGVDGQEDLEEHAQCSICFDDTTKSATVSCGHLYCTIPCLQKLCEMVADPTKRQQPIRCEHSENGEICKRSLTLDEIQQFLPSTTFTRILSGVFNVFIQQHLDEYGICSSPDCTFVYRK